MKNEPLLGELCWALGSILAARTHPMPTLPGFLQLFASYNQFPLEMF